MIELKGVLKQIGIGRKHGDYQEYETLFPFFSKREKIKRIF